MLGVTKVLMQRDNITQEEAEVWVEDCREQMLDSLEGYNGYDAEEILMSEMGLEPDYLFEILGDF